jgi:galactokinase
VTLIGEHTDYNEGCSIGVATPWRTTVIASEGDRGFIEVESAALGRARCSLARPSGPPFVVLAAALASATGVDGARLEVASELPVGAGLSSSAAFAVAVALALGFEGDALSVARVCQRAERAAGADVGLLDQLVVLCAREGVAVDVDFSDLSVETPLVPENIGLTVVDTGVRRDVSSSGYAARRAECAAAAQVIGPLGRASIGDLAALDDELLVRRARHVVGECARVRAARAALAGADLEALGAIIDEGHASLRDDFDVSTSRVEVIRDAVRTLTGVVGARLVGAGFGGCLVVAHDPEVPVAWHETWAARLFPSTGARVTAER